eukprot:260071-Alexandrium_andersonii.AAC.1
MAVRLTQWARGHFKIAKGGRNKMRGAVIRLTLASHDRLLETGQQGPPGPGKPELNANDVLNSLEQSCKSSNQQFLTPDGGVPLNYRPEFRDLPR